MDHMTLQNNFRKLINENETLIQQYEKESVLAKKEEQEYQEKIRFLEQTVAVLKNRNKQAQITKESMMKE